MVFAKIFIGNPITLSSPVDIFADYLSFINSNYFAPKVTKPYRIMFTPPDSFQSKKKKTDSSSNNSNSQGKI